MKNKLKKIFYHKILLSFTFFFQILFFILLTFLLPNRIFAQNLKTNYNIEYFIKKNSKDFLTDVKYTIEIINLKSDIYASKLNITFPKEFKITNIRALSNKQETNVELTNEDENQIITIYLINSKIGKNETNLLEIFFNQEGLLKEFGNIWELMIPNIINKDGEINIIVNLPNIDEKKITIAKPNPSQIIKNNTLSKIIWVNPQTKIIYAIFGNEQHYELNLNYNLKNTNPYPIFTEIAFPPDTLYQKIYIKKIDPLPVNFYSDEDGNFLGKVFLLPGEFKKINFSGFITIYAKPRLEIKDSLLNNIEKQKNKLLTADQKYWQIKNIDQLGNLHSPLEIYNWVLKTLNYDYKKLTKKTERIGAQNALSNPNEAICTEFSDLFIALAREKGILTREIQGYGFSHEEYLRPISLISDILHSWVEYYDSQKKIWVPIDPTWQETSGIDYFNSLDLNHIAFVIHGNKPDYPYPAGSYKIDKTKDVLISPTNLNIQENKNLLITIKSLPKNLYSNLKYNSKIEFENKSNVYLWNIKIKLSGNNINLDTKEIFIPFLIPFEKKSFDLQIVPKTNFLYNKGNLIINYPDNILKKSFIIYPYYFLFLKYIIFILLIISFLFLIIKYGIFSKKN